MTAMTPLNTASDLKKVAFTYDYKSRRVSKQVYQWQTDRWSLSTEHRFVYDGWNLIREITTQGGTSSIDSYVWGLDLSGSLQGAGGPSTLFRAGIGGLLLRHSANETELYTHDANGNVGQLVNSATGALAAHYEYDPFGNTLVMNGPKADKNPFRFSTKYLDTESGLYYYGYRYYAPELGRWINRDPIEEFAFQSQRAKEKNLLRGRTREERVVHPLYLFINNSPLNAVDSLGLDFANHCKKSLWVLKDGIWKEVKAGSTEKGETDAVCEGPDEEGNCSAYKWIDCLYLCKARNCV